MNLTDSEEIINAPYAVNTFTFYIQKNGVTVYQKTIARKSFARMGA